MTRRNHTLVIYAHPYSGSFNHAVLESVTSALERKKRSYDVIDLYADEFDPRYTAEELALFSEGGTTDPLVEKYQGLLDKATRLIIIAPIWWSELPGVVKGFMDKVMKQNWAYDSTNTGVRGRLTHIKQVLVLTTSTAPTWFLKRMAGNSVGSVFLGTIVRQLGMKGRKWVNYGQVAKGGHARRAKHLEKVARLALKH
ncbi:NAD(P)H-dependent oxidoreductase [Actinomyces wuliandei]|uniref:NAD(P)H-dependent oxidoreductase n=1 Tax=Actinomyces wuliandei TaxID=2057743 RepID=UPI000FDA7124|nr:NAD(P)H-dependent oxidoreductase [Actinomyces wuliandei]